MNKRTINDVVDDLIERLANDPDVSILEFHLRYQSIEKARSEFNEAILKIWEIIQSMDHDS